MIDEAEIYRVVGEEGFEKLTVSFYERVKEDDLIGPMYPSNDWEGSEERLREFLLYRFGADQSYLKKRGHPRLRGRHMPFRIGVAERDRWIELMGAAADETIPDDEIRGSIMAFFNQVGDFIRNQPEGEISVS